MTFVSFFIFPSHFPIFFRNVKAIEVVAKAMPGTEKNLAAEEMRRIMTECPNGEDGG